MRVLLLLRDSAGCGKSTWIEKNGLKPCPHCGDTNIRITTCKELADCENYIECNESGYSVAVCDFNKSGCGATGGYRRTREKAIAAWNGENEWVSTKDMLPTGLGKVIDGEIYYKNLYIQYGDNDLTVGFYDEESEKWFTIMGFPPDSVIRWSDCLPEPPKKEQE